jgi:hypothetical protein
VAVELLPDGSLPLDTDPEIWPTLFAYLKRPSMFTLLWTREKGFDYVKYNKLMPEADFFGLSELKEWILQKKYREVVKTGLKTTIHSWQLTPLYDDYMNHEWLHSARWKRPHEGGSIMDQHGSVTRNYQPPEFDPLNEDVELVSCIKAKIPSRGDFLCSSKKGSHIHHDLCKADGDCTKG